jgi:hypothetical protein
MKLQEFGGKIMVAAMVKTIGIGALVALALPSAAMALQSGPIFYNTDEGDGEGDGFIRFLNPRTFTIFGANNDFESSAIYEFVAESGQDVSTVFRYATSDRDGTTFDRAGYFINDTRFQLSIDNEPRNQFQFGEIAFSVLAGDRFGYYVETDDGLFGRGQITIGALPEPSSWALMITGFGLVGVSMRRRRGLPVG